MATVLIGTSASIPNANVVYAAQPSKQSGTGTMTNQGSAYSIQGFSMMFGGYTTSISQGDNGFITQSTGSSRKFNYESQIVELSGKERRLRGSKYVRLAGGGMGYFNYEVRITPSNFNRSNLQVGRSLLDNLYSESNVNRGTLDSRLANGGEGWLNPIISVRTSSAGHSSFYGNRRWTQGSGNYSAPARIYSRYDDWARSANWSSGSANAIRDLYDTRVSFPKIDDSPPEVKWSKNSADWSKNNHSITITASDPGSGVKRIRTRTYNGSWGGWSGWTNGSSKTVTISAQGENNIQVEAEDNAGNSAIYQAGHFKIDKQAPDILDTVVFDARYVNGEDYWYKPGDNFRVEVRGYDTFSRVRQAYLRLYGDGHDNRAEHTWKEHSDNQVKEFLNNGGYTKITSGSVPYYGYTAQYRFNGNISSNAGDRDMIVQSRFHDFAYNESYYTNSGKTMKTDANAPTVSANTTSRGWDKSNVSVGLTYSDSRSGVKGRRYKWSTSTSTPSSWDGYSSTVNQGTDGTWYLHYEAEDNVGNKRHGYFGPYRVDKTAPNGSISGNPSSWTNQNVTLSLNANDSGSGVKRVKRPDGTWVNGSTTSYTVSNNGTYTFQAEDNAGNVGNITATVNRIDKSAPNGSISGNPTNWTNQNPTLTFNATDTGGAGVKRVKRPDGTWSTGSTTSYTVSSNGTYTFQVEDNAGNYGNVSVSVNRIDKSLPNGTVNGNPTSWTNQNVSLSFVGTDVGGSGIKRVSRPDGSWVNGASTSQVITQNGSYTFRVEDNAGNVRSVTAVVNRIDKLAPSGSISGNPTSWTNGNATLTLNATDTGGAGVKRVKSPNGTWANGTKISQTVSSNGTYTFQVEDNAGNYGNVSITVNRIDKTLPQGSITGNPTSWTNQNVTLSFTGVDNGGSGIRQVRKPDGTWVSGATTSYNVSTNGTYTFQVQDNAGNIQSLSTNVNRIDKSLPNGTITGNPTSWTKENVTLSFTGTDVGGSGIKRVSRPDGTWVNGSSTSHVINKNGTYTFRVEDNAGNVRSVTATVTRIDKTLPDGSITGNPTNWTNKDITLSFTGKDNGGSGIKRVSRPDGSWVNGSTTSQVISQNGNYTFRVEDNAGNIRSVTATVNRIDKTLPNGSVSGNPTNWTNQNVTLSFIGTDNGGSGIKQVRRPDGTWVAGATTSQLVTSNGTYTFQVQDNAGNIRSVSTTVTRIDKTNPTANITGNATTWTNQNVTLTITAADADSGVKRIMLPNGTWVNANRTNYTVTSNGTYTFRVEDQAGNVINQSVNVTRIDKVIPGGTISGNATSWTNRDVTLVFNATDSGISGVRRVRIANGTWIEGSKVSRTVSANGNYSFEVEDNAGNTKIVTITVNRIDKVIPEGTITGNPSQWTNQNITLSFNGTDSGGSGVKEVRRPNGTWVSGSATSQTIEKNGTYTFQVRDNAGNLRSISIEVTRIDKVSPAESMIEIVK